MKSVEPVTVELRPPTSQDLNALADIDLKCLDWNWDTKTWASVIRECPSSLAIYGKRAIGFAALQESNEDTYLLGKIAVKRAYRGRGVGKRLFTVACEYARQEGAIQLAMITPESFAYPGPNNRLAWIKSCGFRAHCILPDHYQLYGEKEDAISWKLVL